ncbi:SDR family oxidoreductase [Plantibacter sp. ME-Dv--P-122b]|uniref:SDR family NAD(P)-dependent oxidoreductase n=1 Tax=Plantibacter sp. ME-Dv--P-122b TaxID=3040300 RepID=UPI0025508DDF|nr:SDR family oxidoreductase [Plantibacter sp. ME-Dv--P-122b]
MVSFSLEGKAAFVTGAAQGIGYGVADALIGAGAKLAVVDLAAADPAAAAARLSETHGLEVEHFTCDVTDSAAVADLIPAVADRLGGLDIAVNNAGVGNAGAATETTDEEWRRVYGVNVDGMFYCCREEGRWFIENGVRGSIINTVSISSFFSVPQYQAPYNSSKSAAWGLTRTLAYEWGPHGVRVNSVSPGFTITPMVETPRMKPQQEGWKQITPMGKLATIEDLAGAYVFLASDASGHMTGADLIIDGGLTLR